MSKMDPFFKMLMRGARGGRTPQTSPALKKKFKRRLVYKASGRGFETGWHGRKKTFLCLQRPQDQEVPQI